MSCSTAAIFKNGTPALNKDSIYIIRCHIIADSGKVP